MSGRRSSSRDRRSSSSRRSSSFIKLITAVLFAVSSKPSCFSSCQCSSPCAAFIVARPGVPLKTCRSWKISPWALARNLQCELQTCGFRKALYRVLVGSLASRPASRLKACIYDLAHIYATDNCSNIRKKPCCRTVHDN